MQKKFVEFVDMNSIALIVVSFVFDNLYPNKVDVRDIVGKGYFYNYFTNKTMIYLYDSMVGFAKIISEECDDFDLLYRLDERLAMPADGYVMTTFLRGMYYPSRDVFTHINYTKNEYSGDIYAKICG